jgi:RNA polymerase sigma-70 factor, ECF subfamily
MQNVSGVRAQLIESQLLSSRQRFLDYIRSKIADPELAEDILQESLLRAVQAAPSVRDEERLVPWFRSILQHAIVDTYRRRGVERKHVGEVLPEELGAEPDPEDEAVVCGCFQELIPTLRPEYAELIRAVELGGEAPDAAAERLGITPDNLKVRRHRARQALRQRLQETCRMCADHHCLDCTCRHE